MKIAFVINQTHKEDAAFTTTLLAFKALLRGHSIYYIGLADFVYLDETRVAAHARVVHPDAWIGAWPDEVNPEPGKWGSVRTAAQRTAAARAKDPRLEGPRKLIETIRTTSKERILLADLDVLWLRFDPVPDMINRPWASTMGLQFAQLAQRLGVRVLNDPGTLITAENKLYLENFPADLRPRTLVTRNYADVRQFFDEQDQHIILKPLKGSGGKNVFLVNRRESHNLKQIVEVICRDGYVIAQEYLPEAQYGDIRFFMINGRPLEVDGKYASIHRVQPKGEIRSNIHQGSEPRAAEITPAMLTTVSRISEQLRRDGMYFVGLDLIGEKIMEINVFSPGGIGHASLLNGIDYAAAILEDLERG